MTHSPHSWSLPTADGSLANLCIPRVHVQVTQADPQYLTYMKTYINVFSLEFLEYIEI